MPREAGNLFTGEKGESIFTHAYTDFQLSPNELPVMLQRMEKTGDDRSFVLVDKGLMDSMSSLVRELFGEGTSNSSSARAMFRAVCFVVVSGLQAFRTNVVILRETLDHGDLVEQLGKECHKRFMSRIKTIRSEKPTRVEDKEGWRYSYYTHGVVDIAPCDSKNPPTTVNVDLSEVMGLKPRLE